MILLFLGTLAGILCGVVGGIIPGIHSNTIAGILLGLSPALLALLGPQGLGVLLIAMLITHSFLEILPSTFCGIPDSGTALSVLPAHALTLEGKGEEAVRLSALGSAWGVIIGLPVSVLLYLFIPAFQDSIDWGVGSLLILIMGLIIISSESPFWNLIIFFISGILGLFAFRYEYLAWSAAGSGSVLMPLLTGLFGLSVILTSSQGPIPKQRFSGLGLENYPVIRSAVQGTGAGVMVGWLPGLSTASASAVVNTWVRYDSDQRQYLVATGAASLVNVLVGLAAFFAIERTRSGVMVALSSFEAPSYPILLAVSAGAAIMAYGIVVHLAGCAGWFSGLDGTVINTIVAGFVLILNALCTGPFGLLILLCATGVGLASHLLNIPRVICMGAVTLPVILYSLGIGGF